jgi:hypothetical protein
MSRTSLLQQIRQLENEINVSKRAEQDVKTKSNLLQEELQGTKLESKNLTEKEKQHLNKINELKQMVEVCCVCMCMCMCVYVCVCG